ncbi:MAG TPA: helix-turn-helix domain-containing protein [Pseudomonadales bacterium]|nr:helix-turn-helix domain-containing protein [Pseudomonadales bacterium]
MTIGRLAVAAGTPAENIRYYEKQGMMPEPPRSSGGHRLYHEPHLAQLSFILRARGLGFSQAEVKALLKLAHGSHRSCKRVQRLAEAHLADIREKLADLQRVEDALEGLIAHCEETGQTSNCPIIEALYRPIR